MELYSTKKISPNTTLSHAVLTGLPPDNGLYVPTFIPKLSAAFFDRLDDLSFPDISFEVSKMLIGKAVDEKALLEIVYEAFNFDTPVVKLSNNIHVLELFHGPTLAFKDYGARFMSRLVKYFTQHHEKEINILVATSGDTGSAVGHGFLGVKGINVTILYPKGKVSDIQEKQLTTIGENVTSIEIDGNFDDCQKLVKTSFLDQELNEKLQLTSANSINIARLIPQSFYYFHAYAQLKKEGKPVVVSVPSGNFGNLCGGLLAYQMGLPIAHFIASTNKNDIVPTYLETGLFQPKPSLKTISNAMDVGNPSNFPRILALFNNDEQLIKTKISGLAFDDASTKSAMKEVYQHHNYMMCPHTAVAYLGIKNWLEKTDQDVNAILLATAHPAKFLDVVSPVIGEDISLPPALAQAYHKKKEVVEMDNDFQQLKDYLLGSG